MCGRNAVEPSDTMLVQGIRSGSAPAFEELMRRHRRLVYRIAFGLTRDPDGAMELVQDTFLKVHERLASWRGAGEVRNWIARIAANEAMNRARAARRRPPPELHAVPPPESEPPQHGALRRRESGAALHRALETLPPRQRLAVVLRYFEGLSAREIAAALECSEETARNTLLRSLRKLRSALTSPEETLP
jgi:RNA polymerase sigma-70 factor (ECF subfamily)